MTAINRLNQIAKLSDDDLSVVWQTSSGRTRSINIENFRKFIQSTDPNSDAFVKAELVGDELILTSHDEVETRIDINLLPEHSVTELKDMPDTLLSGQYLKVNEAGNGFVLTPSSEVSTEVLVQQGDNPSEAANVLKFSGGLTVVVENKIATIKSALLFNDQLVTNIYTDPSIDSLIDGGEVTLSVNTKVTQWPLYEVGIGDSPYVIESISQLGIEYQFEASSQFTQAVHLYASGLPEGAQIKVTVINVESNSKPIDVYQLASGSDLRWPVITPTIFTLRSGIWRVEESSQLLHISGATTFEDDAARKNVVHGVAADPSSPITMRVNDDGVLVVGGDSIIDVDGNDTGAIETGSGIKSTYDATSNKTTLEVDAEDIDLSAYAKLENSNSFTAQQKIVNAEFKVEKEDGTNLFRVRPDNETVTVKGSLTSDVLKSLIFDSGQNLNLQIKHNGNTRISVGDTQITATVKVQAQKGLDIQDDSTYTGAIDADESLVNKKYVDDSVGSYDGEGFGVPGRTETGHGTIIQTVITGNYRNTSNETGDLTINLRTDDGVQNFRLYYSMPHGTLSARKVYVKVDEKAGLNKTIRAGEIWQCEVKAGRFFDDFFWSKVTDGESTFEAIDTSSFDPEGVNIEVLKKTFTDKDLVSIPLELPGGFNVLVSSVICKLNGKLKKQSFEYHYENGILRVHLNEVCSGIIIAEIIR